MRKKTQPRTVKPEQQAAEVAHARQLLSEGLELRAKVRAKYEGARTVKEQKLRLLVD